MASDAKTLISMSLRDNASRQLKTFERNWKNTIGNIEQDGAGGLEGAIDGFINSGLGKLTGGIAGFFAVGKLTQTVTELSRLGTEAQRTRTSFDDLAAGVGQSADSMLAAMRAASAGTVADSELMLAANRAMMLGVADNAAEMSGLMAAAIERGRALGVSSSQAVNDIITGIGRMSPMILDNLGIVGVTQAIDQYAVSLGKTADQLTDVERKQALVNAVLSQASAPVVIDDAAAAFERMDASIQNAKEAMGILFGPAVAAIADRLAEAATITAQALTADPLVQAEATISGRVQALLKEAQDAAMVSVAPGAPVGPDDLAGGGLSDQAQRLQLVLFAIQQVDAAQRANISSAGIWADQITRIAERVVAFGDVSDGTLRQVAILLGNISASTAEETLQRTAEAMGALSDATRPTAEQIAATNEQVAGVDRLSSAYEQAAAIVQSANLDGLFAQMLGESGDIDASAEAMKRLEAALIKITSDLIQSGVAGDQLNAVLNVMIQEIGSALSAGPEMGASLSGGLLAGIPAGQALIAMLRDILGISGDAATATEGIGKGAKQAASDAEKAMRRIAGALDAVSRKARMAAGEISRVGRAAAAIDIAAMGNSKLGAGKEIYDPYAIDEPVEKSAESIDILTGAFSDLFDTTVGGGGLSDVNDGLDDLKSKVESVISSAMSADIGGLDPAAFLPREDAINENARRLAAIMRDGIAGQEWLGEFQAEVPALWEELSASGDPQGAAARMLQEFQQGLRPELLDKEQIKARVKAMILGEENTAALAQEIAAELSGELGMSLAQAQQAVAGVMGVGGMGAATGAQVGPDGGAQGSQFVAAWAGMVKTQLTEFENTGKQAGSSWGAGFMATVEGGVPGQLIALLVSLVTPGVLANLSAQGSRTGAQ